MNRRKLRYQWRAWLLGCLLGGGNMLTAQSIHSDVSPKAIRIGERITVWVAVALPDSNTSVSIGWPDSIPHFEPIGLHKPVWKSVANGFEYSQEWVVTSFDSGQWVFPTVPVTIQSRGVEAHSRTDSVRVDVGYAAADTSKDIRDIKPLMPVPIRDDGFYYILAASLLAVFAIIYALILLHRPKQYRRPLQAGTTSAYEEALLQLDALAQSSITDEESKQQFHVQLSTIFRSYLGKTVLQPGLQSTSSDVSWFYQTKHWLDATQTKQLKDAMELSDAVKFARYNPSTTDSLDVLQHIRRVIQSTQDQLNQTQIT